jgi:hypothetical protein
MNHSPQSDRSTNGRVNLLAQPKTTDLFAMYDKIPSNQPSTFREPTLGLWDDTQLSKLFFSKENVTILQNGIRYGVFRASKEQYTVDNQDVDALKIIMRSVFLQHSANMANNVTEQITELNNLVLQYSVKQVYGEAQGYIKYLEDASTMYTPIAPPMMSSTNDKQLFLKSFF